MAISSFDAMLEESYFHGALRELGNDLHTLSAIVTICKYCN